MRATNPGFASRVLIIEAMPRPPSTASDPCYSFYQHVCSVSISIQLTGGQKSSCMSTTIRAGLMVRVVAISELERCGSRELLMEVMDGVMERFESPGDDRF